MKASINPDLAWYVCRAVPGRVFDAESKIRKVGFDVYCPKSRVEKWNGRGHCYTMTHKPAMPPYLFVGFKPGEAHFGIVHDMAEVGGFLGVNGIPEQIDADVVTAILIMETEMKFDNTPQSRRAKEGQLDQRFPLGKEVELVADLTSALSGFRGTVLETNGRDKVHVAFGAIKSWVAEQDVKAA